MSCGYRYADDSPCELTKVEHRFQVLIEPHAFVEPAPQSAPSGDYEFVKFVDGKMIECDGYGNEPGWRERNQPEPSVTQASAETVAAVGHLTRGLPRTQPAPSGDEAKVRKLARAAERAAT